MKKRGFLKSWVATALLLVMLMFLSVITAVLLGIYAGLGLFMAAIISATIYQIRLAGSGDLKQQANETEFKTLQSTRKSARVTTNKRP